MSTRKLPFQLAEEIRKNQCQLLGDINNVDKRVDVVVEKELTLEDRMNILEDKLDNCLNWFEKKEIWRE
jgi:hypothetical protein